MSAADEVGQMLGKYKKTVVSFVLVAAFLPVILAGALSQNGFRTFTKASGNNDLRIWIEPSAVVAHTGQTVKLRIMAEYEDYENPLPKLDVTARLDSGLSTINNQISYDSSFNGKKQIGILEVVARETGEQKVWLDELSVDTGLPNLNVVTTGTLFTVE